MKSPISGGAGAAAGDPALNKRLMTPQPNVEQTSFIRDKMYQWPSIYELSRSLTQGKWGKAGKDVKVGK